jgi:hypothetical protein
MPISTDSLSPESRAAVLARIAYELTICARSTYEVGTENVLEPHVLRAYNELLHRLTGALVSHISGTDGYSLETILEMIRTFGTQHNRVEEIEWALIRSGQQSRKV